MTEKQQITTPSGMGGLQSYNEKTGSKVQISPEMVVIIIGVVILGITAIKFLTPIA
jgi:preprotein translocase subunit Sec61beta